MLRKPTHSRSYRFHREPHLKEHINRSSSQCSSSRQKGEAPLASPEIDLTSNSKFSFSKNLQKKISRSLIKFERRHSLGREKKKESKEEIEIVKEHHSAVEFDRDSINS
ncbi:unnamed protein product [Caenorhabditis angaria]|uniref:Uncharacterized protein n=1 Tax=Caenorhabditis angaria TaxID=860376 RepID=A0A9P1J5W5_9PELO|nr:unnamed protein product [Caenorhabditis angaria]